MWRAHTLNIITYTCSYRWSQVESCPSLEIGSVESPHTESYSDDHIPVKEVGFKAERGFQKGILHQDSNSGCRRDINCRVEISKDSSMDLSEATVPGAL